MHSANDYRHNFFYYFYFSNEVKRDVACNEGTEKQNKKETTMSRFPIRSGTF